jgi:hypothetical protein
MMGMWSQEAKEVAHHSHVALVERGILTHDGRVAPKSGGTSALLPMYTCSDRSFDPWHLECEVVVSGLLVVMLHVIDLRAGVVAMIVPDSLSTILKAVGEAYSNILPHQLRLATDGIGDRGHEDWAHSSSTEGCGIKVSTLVDAVKDLFSSYVSEVGISTIS